MAAAPEVLPIPPSVPRQVLVAIDSFQVAGAGVLLTADLRGALALCLHDENRGFGGLLHLRLASSEGSVDELTDNMLSSILVVLDRFKRSVLGSAAAHWNAGQADASASAAARAQILAHLKPASSAGGPSASLIDLIAADLADGRIVCRTRKLPAAEAVRVLFEPRSGRLWSAGPERTRTLAARSHIN